MTVQFVESIASSIAKSGGNRWKVVLAVPGEGNGGNYSRKVLAEQGPAAIPAGTKAFIGHSEPEKRNPLTQFGKYPTGAYYDDTLPKDKYPDGGLVAELEVRKSFIDTIEEMGDDAELSMYVRGDTDDDGNVIALYPYRGNSVDLVAFGALEGSGLFEKISESLDSGNDKPSGETSAQEKEKEKMEKEMQEAIEAAVKSAIAALAEAPKVKTQAEIDADVKAAVEAEVGAKVDEALEGAIEQLKAIDDAELVPALAESLKADVKKGKDITEALTLAKATMADFKTLQESLGNGRSPLINESSDDKDDFIVHGLRFS